MAKEKMRTGPKVGTHQTAEHRANIDTAMILRRFDEHFRGEIELTPTQVRVGEILLRKTVPDLSQTDLTATHVHRYVIEAPSELSREEWEKRYSPPQPTIQ